MLVQSIPAGPLDVVGDVHGEWAALQELLALLGYSKDGTHPAGRRLLFLGDLVDRGPDSLAVLRFVERLVRLEHGYCILGNHELNLLLEKSREGNEWFYGNAQQLREGGLIPQVLATAEDRAWITERLLTFPLVVEQPGFRAVHACWEPSAVDRLRHFEGNVLQAFRAGRAPVMEAIRQAGAEMGTVEADILRQNVNPVTVLTSGMEERAEEPFWAGGQKRKVRRVKWWNNYVSATTVVFGHYWRALSEDDRPVKRGPYLFSGVDPMAPLGPHPNAWCVDYSVGYRHVERARGAGSGMSTALAALRFPERELVFT